ncbi:MAG: hypothetical protein RID91_08950 [Azospirillaceae bacterium]
MPPAAPLIAGVAAGAQAAFAGTALATTGIFASTTVSAIAIGFGTAAIGFRSQGLAPKPESAR